jgi:hypothetical protein
MDLTETRKILCCVVSILTGLLNNLKKIKNEENTPMKIIDIRSKANLS